MKKTAFVIILVSAFVLFYNISPFIGIPFRYIMAMFIIAPFALLFMVYIILKYGKPSGKTFDEFFYDDYDHTKH